MKPLDTFTLSSKDCLKELDALGTLLHPKHKELKERQHILPFFRKHKNVAALIGIYAPRIVEIDRLNIEYSLYGDFRADLIIGDWQRKNYCMVEFEDATKDSVFKATNRTTTEWSDRFNHGFGQLVDWLWKVDDFRNTGQGRSIFGNDTFSFMGVLVIGRDAFLTTEEAARLEWRMNKVNVDSNKIVCVTFDQLASDLRDKLTIYKSMEAAISTKALVGNASKRAQGHAKQLSRRTKKTSP
jgi:hypothetical protein